MRYGLMLAALAACVPAAAHAKVVSGSSSIASCLTTSGSASNCTDRFFISTTFAGLTTSFLGVPQATFTSAFNSWNAVNGGLWTLVNGGAVNVTITPHLQATADALAGGLGEVLFTLNGSQQTLANLVWTQALVINYSPLTGALAAPELTLDTFSLSQDPAGDNPSFPKTCVAASSGASPAGGAFCGPIYPFQYGSTLANETYNGVPLGVDPFYDAPQGLWPNNSFDAISLLSSVSPSTDTLTVYQGVNYGFSLAVGSSSGATASASALDGIVLSAPEPSTWATLIAGFAGLGLMGCRRRVRSSPPLVH